MQTARAFLLGAALALGVATQAAAQPQPALPNFADLVEKHGPAVVNIRTEARAQRTQVPGLSEDDPMFEFFRRFMPPDQRPQPRGRGERNEKGEPRGGPLRPFGLGSGFVISADGYIVTNAHVIENAEVIHVRFTDKREMKAKVIGADKRSDVALVKVEAANLPFLKLGDSNAVRVGEWVLAIGSPFGFANSVTAGILSAKSRDLPADSGASDAVPFLQTDVAVNPGNSGGPLFNLKGEVIGINSQIFSRTGGFQGVAFAIPIDVALNVAEQIRETGTVQHGRLGVTVQPVDQALAENFGLPGPKGALVGSVQKGSPAEKAGLEPGDVIVGFNGRAIERSTDLPPLVAATRPGSTAKVDVWRDGAAKSLDLTIGSREAPRRVASADDEAAPTGRLGVAVRPLTPEEKSSSGLARGVVVEEVGGAAAKAGVQPGDVIVSVNRTPVTSPEALKAAIDKAGKSVALLVQRDDARIFIPVTIG